MAVEASPPSTVGNTPIERLSSATAHLVDPAFEERSAAWQARGLRHEVVMQRRLRVIALIIAVLLGLVTSGIVISRGAL